MALFLLSCSTDAYDKGEGTYSLMRAELADVHVGADKRADYFVTDGDDRLTIDNPFTTRLFTTADSIYRMALYYKEVSAAHAEAVSLSAVAVLRPKDIAEDEMRTDPVRFESAWLSQNRHYLNASIYLMLGTTDNDSLRQVLGIRADTLCQNADGTRTLRLRLYHDQASVPEYYSQRTYVSIPLTDIGADSVALCINTYQGIVERTIATR